MAGTDFSHLTDDELLNGIKALNIPDYIRTKSYGVDVRETLAQMTEMLMQLALNQGMSPQEAQDFLARFNNKINKGEVTMSDLTQEVKEALTGGAVAVVGVDAVGNENLKRASVRKKNIYLSYDNLAKHVSFEVGTISGKSGELLDNPNRARSEEFIVKAGDEIRINDTGTTTYAVRYWDLDGTYRNDMFTEFTNTPIKFYDNFKIRVVQRYTQEATITDLDYFENNFFIIDSSVGFTKDETKEQISQLKTLAGIQTINLHNDDWELGSLGLNDGTLSENNTRVRTKETIVLKPGKVYVEDALNFKVNAFIYDKYGSYIKSTGWNTSILFDEETTVKLLVAYQDNKVITNIDNVTRTVVVESKPTTQINDDTERKVILRDLGSRVIDKTYRTTEKYPEDLLITDIYPTYDALVASQPNYVSMSNLGVDEEGLPINVYRFNDGSYDSVSSIPKLKIIITTGTHGNEKNTVISTMRLCESLVSDYHKHDFYEFMRQQVDLYVIPIVNPAGFNANTRENSNGMDLNRDYPTTLNYDLNSLQLSTQLMVNFLDEHKNADLFIDYHRTGWVGDGLIAFGLTDDSNIEKITNQSLKRTTKRWQSEYDFFPQAYDYKFGYTGSLGQARLANYTQLHGVDSVLLEMVNRIEWEIDPPFYMYNDLITTAGVELLTNNIRDILQYRL